MEVDEYPPNLIPGSSHQQPNQLTDSPYAFLTTNDRMANFTLFNSATRNMGFSSHLSNATPQSTPIRRPPAAISDTGPPPAYSPIFLMDLPSQSQNQYQQQPQHQMGYPQYGVSAGMSNQYISQAAAMATAAASGQQIGQMPPLNSMPNMPQGPIAQQRRMSSFISSPLNQRSTPIMNHTIPRQSVPPMAQAQQVPAEEIVAGDVEESPLYVNAKQFHRILKRRVAHQKLEDEKAFRLGVDLSPVRPPFLPPVSWELELEDEDAFQQSEASIAGEPPEGYSNMRPEKPEEDRITSSRKSRRGRGQRKNNAYWNWRERNSDLGIFDRDILVSGKNGSLTIPGIARLDSSFNTPFCISEKYLKQQGRGHEIDANIADDERHSVSDDQLDIAGIIRKFPFRVKGTSRVFFQDFIVSKALDDVADMVIGWQFMLEEFKLLFDNVREKVAGVFGEVVSSFSSKIAKISSALRNRASEFLGRAHSPSPPYSLCDVFEPDFTVMPNYS